MKLCAIMLLCGGWLVLTTSAQADELPRRKAGYWVTKQYLHRDRHECVDEANDRRIGIFGDEGKCSSKFEVRKTDTGYSVDAECNPDIGETATHWEITGDFNSAYSVKSTTKYSLWTSESKWLGDCPVGWKPGDMDGGQYWDGF